MDGSYLKLWKNAILFSNIVISNNESLIFEGSFDVKITLEQQSANI